MGTGYFDDSLLDKVIGYASNIPGDFAEIGVFKGVTFHRLAKHANRLGKIAHAFDSFVGMDEPGDNDGGEYPKGKFDIGGMRGFIKFMDMYGVDKSWYNMWQGYVPDCFNGFNLPLSFCYIDLDHYEPTIDAIKFAVKHLSSGGVLGFDDYNPDWNNMAALAIKQWLAATPHKVLWIENDQLFLTLG